MEIPLKIDVEDELCGSDCMFKDTSFHLSVGKCLLFNEPLEPLIEFGSVQAWNRCEQCNRMG